MVQASPLREGAAFGCRVSDISFEDLQEPAIQNWLRSLLIERGLIVFDRVEATDRMQIAISAVFGPLKEYAMITGDAPQPSAKSLVVEIESSPELATIVEIDGEPLQGWMPWHFDQCYNATMNGMRVLRAGKIAPAGGLTCFLDGIELYRSIPKSLRKRIEEKSVVYTMDMDFDHLRFGRPDNFRLLRMDPSMQSSTEQALHQPRAVHPAVWIHPTREKVLHVSPWMAVGIEGEETHCGGALLEELSREINRLGRSQAYRHAWREGEILVWDNCRMLHAVTGCDPAHPRSMHRSTIGGDYGLGRWDHSTRPVHQ